MGRIFRLVLEHGEFGCSRTAKSGEIQDNFIDLVLSTEAYEKKKFTRMIDQTNPYYKLKRREIHCSTANF